MRIVMVLPSMPAAGMEVLVGRLSLGLKGRGHDVSISCIEELGSLGEALRSDGVAVEVIPMPGLWSNVNPHALTEHLRRLDPDVVHVHSGAWLKAARAAHLAGVLRVVHTVHGLHDVEPWYGPALMRWATRLTDAVVAVPAPLVSYLVDDVRLPSVKVHLVPNGIDTQTYEPGPHTGRIRAGGGMG